MAKLNHLDARRHRLAQQLAAGRRQSRLSQSLVAAQLGLSRSAISDLESGKRRIEAVEFLCLLEAYGLSPNAFADAPATTSTKSSATEDHSD